MTKTKSEQQPKIDLMKSVIGPDLLYPPSTMTPKQQDAMRELGNQLIRHEITPDEYGNKRDAICECVSPGKPAARQSPYLPEGYIPEWLIEFLVENNIDTEWLYRPVPTILLIAISLQQIPKPILSREEHSIVLSKLGEQYRLGELSKDQCRQISALLYDC